MVPVNISYGNRSQLLVGNRQGSLTQINVGDNGVYQALLVVTDSFPQSSPSSSSGPFRLFAFFTEPSASRWKSITNGALVVKNRISRLGEQLLRFVTEWAVLEIELIVF